MKTTTILTASCALLINSVASAQDGGTVSRAEYNKLKKEMAEMRAEMKALKQTKTANTGDAQPTRRRASTAENSPKLDSLLEQVETLKTQVKETIPGSTKFLFGGYATAGFTSGQRTGSNFTAQFNPIFLWKMSDRLFFEGEMEMELAGSSTDTKLEMAQISYVVNDYMTLGAGKFLNPANYFVERQHSAWINKLPDKPLAVYDGLMPESNVGVQLRGVIPLGSMKLEYAAFASNAPSLKTMPDVPGDLSTLGTLEYDNFDNQDGHIAVGGHVGFIPVPELEIGYGIQRSSVGPRGSSVHALMHSVDFSYVRDSELFKGMINLRGQWVWSSIGNYVYDADSSLGFGPFAFDNQRSGGYAQIAYRPTKFGNDFVKNLEPVFRYDVLNQDKTPVAYNEHRYTVGLNYWLAPSTVLKVAYEIDHKSNNVQSNNMWMVQFATGF
jgi:hypothetical protein